MIFECVAIVLGEVLEVDTIDSDDDRHDEDE